MLFSWPLPVRSQASLNLDVSQNRDVYRELEILIGFGLIPNAVQAQKPWSANEIQSYLGTAQMNLGKLCQKQTLPNCPETQADLQVKILAISQKIKRYSPKPEKTLDILPAELQAHYYYLDSPFVTAPPSNSLGNIDAQINPLTNYFAGRHFVDGTQYSWELNHGLQLSPYFIGFAHYRFENLFPSVGSDDTNFIFHKAYGKLQYKNWAVQVGRENLTWGQGENGGLFFTNHARPLDMIVLSNDKPFTMPWILKLVGPTNVSIFGAYLGPNSYFSHGFLMGHKVTFKPWRIFELGLANMVMMGGDGAPQSDFGRTFGDFLGFSTTSDSTSNRIIVIDTALTVPFLRNTRLYSEIGFDDKSQDGIEQLIQTFTGSTAYTAGIFIPRLNPKGTLQWRIEGVYTSQLFYRHWQYRSGMVLDHLLFGDPLGPDGYRLMSKFYWQTSPKLHLNWSSAFEGRDSNHYDNTNNQFIVTREGPTDKRLRNTLQATQTWNETISSDFYLGYEHAFDFGYQDGTEENNYFLGMSTRFALWR